MGPCHCNTPPGPVSLSPPRRSLCRSETAAVGYIVPPNFFEPLVMGFLGRAPLAGCWGRRISPHFNVILEIFRLRCVLTFRTIVEAPSCLSALHSALGALVTENEAEIEGAEVMGTFCKNACLDGPWYHDMMIGSLGLRCFKVKMRLFLIRLGHQAPASCSPTESNRGVLNFCKKTSKDAQAISNTF